MTAPRFTFVQPYPGGRVILMLGDVQAGACYPPQRITTLNRSDWTWRFWLCAEPYQEKSGRANTEQAAKNAILAQATDWLRKAGLME